MGGVPVILFVYLFTYFIHVEHEVNIHGLRSASTAPFIHVYVVSTRNYSVISLCVVLADHM